MPLDWKSKAFIALPVMGLAIAIYHAYGEITFTLTSCSISAVLNCASVFASGYTSFLGVSFWVYGVVWFPFLLALGLWSIKKYGTPPANMMLPILMVGNIFTLYPWDIEIRILGGVYCPVCVSMYFVNYILTFVALTSRGRAPSAETQEEKWEDDGWSPPKENAT